MKKTEYIRKSGKYYPNKPYNPYNMHPYTSVMDVRDRYGDFVESTDGYTYFIVWIQHVPGNKPKVELFVDKEEAEFYMSNSYGYERDWLHYIQGTDCLLINGRSAEELNNYIAKILMDFYNKRIYEYIEKNKPKTQSTLSVDSHHIERSQPVQSSSTINSSQSDRTNVDIEQYKKIRMENRMAAVRRIMEMKARGADFGLSNLEDENK
ncbi:hypothetical protein [Xylanibacter ruminicola]|uniref:hypothetical protein n=1 Tax=Xylanibacter ruminicola TaxID=839 RepID=UPI00048E444D|nr:hypothetical protein [Xylanibacter ruminicola]